MTVATTRSASSWFGGFATAVVVHGMILFGVNVAQEVPPPPIQVDTTLADLVRPPPPPPAPPTEPIVVRENVSQPEVAEKVRRPPRPTDEAPPPPSNRPPPPKPPPEPVPIITGVSIPTLTVHGVRVRSGNTDVPGFDPPSDKKPSPPQAYSGGVTGGTAPMSGGRGEPGPGVGGGVHASRLTKPARLLKRFRPPYPRELRDENVEGKIELRIEVLSTGRTGRVKLIRGTHPELDNIAVAAAKRFIWSPGEVQGEPVTSWVRHTFRFQLFD